MTLTQRRWTAWSVFALADIFLIVFGGHRGVHALRSFLLPGAGLYDHQYLYIGIAFTVMALLATILWLQWGTDTILCVVIASAVLTSAFTASSTHPTNSSVLQSAHEFPLIIVIAGAMSWIRITFGSNGFIRKSSRSTQTDLDLNSLSPVERCQAVAIFRLAGIEVDYKTTDIEQRARRINFWARGKRNVPPYFRYHSHARVAHILLGETSERDKQNFVAESQNSLTGVPMSEPTWCRLLDGTLSAIALQRLGNTKESQRWSHSLATHFAPRRTHRPTALWTPLAIRMSHASPWEHATATALAHCAGLCGTEDWQFVRKSALGAAARGAHTAQDQRLVAAGRIWASVLSDTSASHILNKTTIGSDPLAAAINSYALTHRTRNPQQGIS